MNQDTRERMLNSIILITLIFLIIVIYCTPDYNFN